MNRSGSAVQDPRSALAWSGGRAGPFGMRNGIRLLLFAVGLARAGCAMPAIQRVQSNVSLVGRETEPVMIIQGYRDALAGVRAANPDVHLSVGRDPTVPGEAVLFVDYPPPTADPASRDVQCDAEVHDWTAGRAVSFHVKPGQSSRLSVSFLDRSRVAYTAWADLKGGVWQEVRIPFDEIRPNPYFQFPDAKTGAPIDVSAVKGIAFAPQDQQA